MKAGAGGPRGDLLHAVRARPEQMAVLHGAVQWRAAASAVTATDAAGDGGEGEGGGEGVPQQSRRAERIY